MRIAELQDNLAGPVDDLGYMLIGNRLLDRLYPRLWYSDTSTRAVSHGENVARGGRYLWICYGRECKRRLEKIQESDEIKTLHTAVCIL